MAQGFWLAFLVLLASVCGEEQGLFCCVGCDGQLHEQVLSAEPVHNSVQGVKRTAAATSASQHAANSEDRELFSSMCLSS